MPTPTTHLGLTRPAQTDFYNVNEFNENASRIDEAIGRMEEGFVPPANALMAISTQAESATARTANVVSPFVRTHGTVVWVKFQNRVTAANATLNVSGTGTARMIVGADEDASVAGFITPGRYYCFMFTQNETALFWHLLNPDGQTIPRGLSTTAAATAGKATTITGFERKPGALVWLTFSTQNTAVSPTLNISSTGAAAIASHSARQITIGRRHAFAFDGVSYQLVMTDASDETELFGTVTTAAGTATKVATIPGFVRQRGATVWLRFTTRNTARTPALNINATDALPIQFNGAALPSGAIIANGVYGFVFDGAAWEIMNPTLSPVATEILNMIYPVGSIYMSVTDANPSTFIGGTWERWGNGRVPVGVDEGDSDFTHTNVNGRTGGAKTVTLTATQMPNHSHTVHSHSHAAGDISVFGGSHNHELLNMGWTGIPTASGTRMVIGDTGGFHNQLTSNTAHVHFIDGNTGATSPGTTAAGGNTAHSNIQPYITCFMWRRTA